MKFNLFKKNENNTVADDEIVAIADGVLVGIDSIPDPMFSEQMMGKTIAFKFNQDKIKICSPANGKLIVLFPTGHAFGIRMNNGVELLIHIGIDTINSKGQGFRILNHKQDSMVKANDPIIEVDFKALSANYDMSTMLIVTNPNQTSVSFIKPQKVVKGQSLLAKQNI